MSDKLKAVVEAAGEKWHIWCTLESKCLNCGNKYPCTNPSPTDLNELIRLTENLEYRFVVHRRHDSYMVRIYLSNKPHDHVMVTATTPAEALLNALFEAIKGR
jgi:hypothetical protein